MAVVKIGSYDLDITQSGDAYVVSGKDAANLHAKMQGAPEEIIEFAVGDLNDDNTFTLKMQSETAPTAST